MVEEILRELPSLGIAGLLFVMWWVERQERARGVHAVQDALHRSHEVLSVNDHLLDVIRSNTEALMALREELHVHRETETEWFGRVSRQLEKFQGV